MICCPPVDASSGLQRSNSQSMSFCEGCGGFCQRRSWKQPHQQVFISWINFYSPKLFPNSSSLYCFGGILRGQNKRKKRRKYQLDWLPIWSSQGLGPRDSIWEGEKKKRKKRRKNQKEGGKEKGNLSYHSVITQCKMEGDRKFLMCASNGFLQGCVTFSTHFWIVHWCCISCQLRIFL